MNYVVSDLQYISLNQCFKVPIGDDLFSDEVDHDRAGLTARVMPEVPVPRERIAIASHCSIIDENFTLLSGLGIDQSNPTALGQGSIILGEHFDDDDHRCACSERMQNIQGFHHP